MGFGRARTTPGKNFLSPSQYTCPQREIFLSSWRRTVNLRRPERAQNEGFTGPDRSLRFALGFRLNDLLDQSQSAYALVPPRGSISKTMLGFKGGIREQNVTPRIFGGSDANRYKIIQPNCEMTPFLASSGCTGTQQAAQGFPLLLDRCPPRQTSRGERLKVKVEPLLTEITM